MPRGLAIAAAAFFIGAAAGCFRSPTPSAASELQIRLVLPASSPDAAFIEVTGLGPGEMNQLRKAAMSDEQWASLLRVTVRDDERGVPAMVGSYSAEGNSIRFMPRFAFDPGRLYSVVFDPSRLPSAGASGRDRAHVAAVVSRPKTAAGPPTEVAHVYPSAEVVPENELRLYIHFTAPMSRRGGLDYIHLVDE